MGYQLKIERHYANGDVIVDNCACCDIYPNALNGNGIEKLHIEPYDDTICITNSIGSSIIPKKIIFNGPATIVMWTDGTKTVVKQSNIDDYDYEKGFAMCVVKKVFGDQYTYIRKLVKESYKDIHTDTDVKPESYETPLTEVLRTIFGKDKQ